MYTAVLMAALTTTPATQAWHRHGCCGCYASYGCSCNCGWSCAYGGCYGCWGPWYGSAYTSGSYGWAGRPINQFHGCYGCYGCYGGYSCCAYSTHYAPIEQAPPSMTPDKKTDGKGKVLEEAPLPKERKINEQQARARVIVDLPADAKLYVDGQLMNTTSARRIFQTPQLPVGQLYYYDLKAEVVRDGQTMSATQKLILRPGQAASASFADLGRKTDATAQVGQQ